MLNCVFWRHILLEIEFKSRVDMGSDSNRYSVQRYSPGAAAQLSTPKKNKKKKNRNGGILRLRLAYGRRSNEPTRVTSTSATLIDLILPNTPENILQSGVIHLGISDHSLVYALRISPCQSHSQNTRMLEILKILMKISLS